MVSRRLLPFSIAIVGLCAAVSAQSPTYGVGRTPTADELKAWDISISPDGHELPAGHGTATEGAPLYRQKGCGGCHGPNGNMAQAPTLIKSDGSQRNTFSCLSPCVNDNNVMALHSPYATVMWDYINRGMPLGKEGSLKPDEVYALTAFLLSLNEVIPEDFVLDAQSLPKVKMPIGEDYASLPDWKPKTRRMKGYPY